MKGTHLGKRTRAPRPVPVVHAVRLAARRELRRQLNGVGPPDDIWPRERTFAVEGDSVFPRAEFARPLEQVFAAVLLHGGDARDVAAATGLNRATILAGLIDLSRGARVEWSGGKAGETKGAQP